MNTIKSMVLDLGNPVQFRKGKNWVSWTREQECKEYGTIKVSVFVDMAMETVENITVKGDSSVPLISNRKKVDMTQDEWEKVCNNKLN